MDRASKLALTRTQLASLRGLIRSIETGDEAARLRRILADIDDFDSENEADVRARLSELEDPPARKALLAVLVDQAVELERRIGALSSEPERRVEPALASGSWRDTWTTAALASPSSAATRARTPTPSSRTPQSPAPVSPARTAPPAQRPFAVAPVSGPESLDAQADELIRAYQETLAEAKRLPADQRALVVHVVAQSASRASQQARQLRSEQVADRLKRFRDDLPDLLGKVLGIGREQATKWAKGQMGNALTGAAIGSAATKFALAVGACIGGVFAGLANIGVLLSGSGSGLHLLVLGVSAALGWFTNNAHSELEQARRAADPATSLLQRTLDPVERRFFDEIGAKPPARMALRATGPVLQAGVAFFIGLLGFVIAAVILGVLTGIAASAS